MQTSRGHAHEDDPGHPRTMVKTRDKIGSKYAGKELKEGGVHLQDREEEEHGDRDAEQVPQCRLSGWYADKDTTQGVCDDET